MSRLLVVALLQLAQPEHLALLRREAAQGLLELPQQLTAVAGLGGFLGRKGDGDPGWQTLWRGWQRVQDLCWGMHQIAVPGDKCG